MGRINRIVIASVLGAITLTRQLPQYAPFKSYIANFLAFLLPQLLCLLIWTAFLWPFYFSPLKNVPEPKVCH